MNYILLRLGEIFNFIFEEMANITPGDLSVLFVHMVPYLVLIVAWVVTYDTMKVAVLC